MSDNPFASPTQNPGNAPQIGGQYQGPAKTPTAITAVTIISLILGVLGLLGVCAGAGGVLMTKSMTSTFEEMADKDPQMKMQLDIQQAQQKFMLPTMIVMGLNFFVASGLVIGSIMTLMRKQVGPGLLKNCFLVAILYCIARFVFSVITQLMTKSEILEKMKLGPNPEIMVPAFEIGIWIGIGFAVVQALVLIGFYIFGGKKFGSDEGQRYFATFR